MSKEQKRDSNGRFTKKSPKVEVKVNVEPKPEKDLSDLVCISRGEWEQLKLERDAFKETAERFMGKYLTVCADKKVLERELNIYKKYWAKLKRIALYWKRYCKSQSQVIKSSGESLAQMAKDYDNLLEFTKAKIKRISVLVPWYRRSKLHEIIGEEEAETITLKFFLKLAD